MTPTEDSVMRQLTELRSHCTPDEDVPVGLALAEFLDVSPTPGGWEPAPANLAALPKRRLAALGAACATVTGKVLLSVSVAAASVGGLHATDLVDFPAMIETPPAQTIEPALTNDVHPLTTPPVRAAGPPTSTHQDLPVEHSSASTPPVASARDVVVPVTTVGPEPRTPETQETPAPAEPPGIAISDEARANAPAPSSPPGLDESPGVANERAEAVRPDEIAAKRPRDHARPSVPGVDRTPVGPATD